MLRRIPRKLVLLVLLALVVFLLPTWWLRIWLPRQGGVPTPATAASQPAADALYRQALALAASQPLDALPLLDSVIAAQGVEAAAAASLRQGIQNGRRGGDPAYLLAASGQALAALGEWPAARQAFLAAVAANPDFAEAWAYLGEALQQNGQDGLAALQQAEQLDPNSLALRLFFALYWQRQGDYARAEQNLRIAALHHPQNPMVQMQLAENAVLTGDTTAALPYLQRALELAPHDPAVWRAVAAYSVESALFVEEVGLPTLERLAAEQPDSADTLVLSARALALLRREAEAEAYFQRALELDDANVAAHVYFGIFLLADRRYEAARQHLNQVLALEPAGPRAELAAYWLAQMATTP
ncbi:MAG: tetratricopeptide repeat protein [Anaerolineales bacterium]|jgi:tetratricopeptide (TPR) repeat protein|nr:tetratricopeptide repeat protein [Anaerolineales bacterium]MBX3006223.1 tetratricopeptide repeat protein [Anaerolineales bacterium]MCW5838289.1 tetratricopeptide repeat protein [Anaerolineales bacterium]MCW5888549.1 tetratricopeptide repeat protein [Anaerolineales bacterium]